MAEMVCRSIKDEIICKNLKTRSVFDGFCSKAVQESFVRPKKAPKRHLKSSKGFKEMDPKMEPILATFGALLGPIVGPKSAPKGDQKWDQFWNHVPPGTQGSRPSAFRNYTRVVKKLLELELYYPKEREGFWCIYFLLF